MGDLGSMWPLAAPCWVPLGSRERAVGQWYYDEEMGPLCGMCGLVKAEFEVQRTTKRAVSTE